MHFLLSDNQVIINFSEVKLRRSNVTVKNNRFLLFGWNSTKNWSMVMKSKEDRFKEWRQEKAKAEEIYIKSALMIGEYINSVQTLEQIKNDFRGVETKQYKALDAYGNRVPGSLLYCKLALEEALETEPEMIEMERKLLTEIRDILGHIYENPTSDVRKRLVRLMGNIRQYLDEDIMSFSDPKRNRELGFVLYAMLCLMYLKLDNLSWTLKLAISSFINIGQIKQEITDLVKKTEKQVGELDELILNNTVGITENVVKVKSTQDTLIGLMVYSEDNTEQLTLMNIEQLKPFAEKTSLDGLSMWFFSQDKPGVGKLSGSNSLQAYAVNVNKF